MDGVTYLIVYVFSFKMSNNDFFKLEHILVEYTCLYLNDKKVRRC